MRKKRSDKRTRRWFFVETEAVVFRSGVFLSIGVESFKFEIDVHGNTRNAEGTGRPRRRRCRSGALGHFTIPGPHMNDAAFYRKVLSMLICTLDQGLACGGASELARYGTANAPPITRGTRSSFSITLPLSEQAQTAHHPRQLYLAHLPDRPHAISRSARPPPSSTCMP
ncbi:hypothetical protein B0H11DRAFT_1983488 [Mycena galericulata]|nr:hypothetical protein B0H11DRAFT_1983488 [Mycena galericulata]